MRDAARLRYGGRQVRNEMERVLAAYVDYYVAADPPPGTEVRLDVDQAGTFSVKGVEPAESDAR
jgi:hypothetical protein